jgi:hypothetical protein
MEYSAHTSPPRRLGDLTRDYERMHEASAFLASKLAIGALGAIAHDPDILGEFFRHRTAGVPVHIARIATKAAVAPVDLSSALAPARRDGAALLGQVDRASPLGRLAAITIDGSVTAPIQTGNATASWSGEQSSKPVSALSFNAESLRPLKLTATVVVSRELADLSAPRALTIVERALVSAAASAEGDALLDPTNAGIVDVKPKSLTNGVTATTATSDFTANLAAVLGALGSPSRPALILSFGSAVRAQAAVRDLSDIGVRVIIDAAAGDRLIAVDSDGVLVTTGGIDVVRGQPDLEMSDTPTSPPTSATVMTSLWHRNLVAIKVERWVSWAVRPGSVAYLDLP